jgi:general secretion pathway protein D
MIHRFQHFLRRRYRHTSLKWSAAFLIVGLVAASGVQAQEATITPNYKDADIRQVIEAVGEITGKNFVLDPRVKAQVTMLSSAPMTPDAFYEAFLSILQVYGFVAVPSGNLIKILPDANARQLPGSEQVGADNLRSDDIVTRVIPVENIAAAQLVPILRPLIPQYGHLAAHPASNMLIISDRAANVDRMLRIIWRIDKAGDDDFDVIRLEHASAAEIVRIVNSLNQGAAAAQGGGTPTSVVADDRTNSVLIGGDKNKRLRIRALIAHLDTPLETGGDTQVRYLRYADSEELATKLQTQYQQQATEQGGPAETGDITIWADQPTNALIITAPPKVMRSIMAVVDKLDIRRLQVLLEAIIVAVESERAACHRRHRAGRGDNWCRRRRSAASFIAKRYHAWRGSFVGNGPEFRRTDRGPRGRHQQQYYGNACFDHAGQRRSRDQGRTGSAVRHRRVHEYRRSSRVCEPVPDGRARAGRPDAEDHATDQ